MYNIDLPHVAHLDEYKRVSSARAEPARARLLTIVKDVEDAYDEYHSCGTDLRDLEQIGFTSMDKPLLRDNFRLLNRGASCEDIRMSLLSMTDHGMCPYCRLGEATSLDHILAKAPYPEYAVLRSNLAPCCQTCNTTKQYNSGRVADRGIFHLYFLGFPSEGFLDVEVQVESSDVRYRFYLFQPAWVDEDNFDALKTHFFETDLANRYARRARIEMRDRAEHLQDIRNSSGPSAVQEFLLRVAKSAASQWSWQDWLPTLLSRAASTPEFCSDGVFLV